MARAMNRQPATDKDRIVAGLAATGFGLFILLLGFGVIPYDPRSLHGPLWTVIVAGLIFTVVGVGLLAGAMTGTIDASGEIEPTAPWLARFCYYVVALLVSIGLAAIGSWVAFGPGHRTFNVTGLFAMRDVGEILGRTIFGIGAVLSWLCVIALAIGGGRKLFGRSRS